jgi:hypothetical protein
VQDALPAGTIGVTDIDTGRPVAWSRVAADTIELHTRAGGSYRIAR